MPEEKKIPGWVAPAAGVGIAAAIVGVGVYLATKPQYVGEPGAEAPGAGPSSIFTPAPVSQYTHEQIPVRALIYTQPPEGLTAQWFADYSTVDAAWVGLNHVAKLDVTEFAKLSASKQAAVKQALTDAGAFWQIRNQVDGPGGDAEAVMYEGGFPLPMQLPSHKSTYDAYQAKLKADASAAATAAAQALLPVEDVQYEQFFKIDMITTNDPATAPVGTTTVTITNPDGTADQSFQAASHDIAIAKARAAVQQEMKGVTTSTDYRGYKLVVTNFPKRDPKIGSKYEMYYVAPDGTQGPILDSDTSDVSPIKNLINQTLGPQSETVYYNNYAINIDYNSSSTPPYSIKSIYDNHGEKVAISIPATTTRDDALAKGKSVVDTNRTYRQNVINQYKLNKTLDTLTNADIAAAEATARAQQQAALDQLKSLAQLPASETNQTVIMMASAFAQGKKATYNNYNLIFKSSYVVVTNPQGFLLKAYGPVKTGDDMDTAINQAMKDIDTVRSGGKLQGFQNGAVVDWRRRLINPQGFEGYQDGNRIIFQNGTSLLSKQPTSLLSPQVQVDIWKSKATKEIQNLQLAVQDYKKAGGDASALKSKYGNQLTDMISAYKNSDYKTAYDIAVSVKNSVKQDTAALIASYKYLPSTRKLIHGGESTRNGYIW